MLRFLAESGVIVASILLAFALEAWWDTRRGLEDLDEMLGLVDEELRQNTELLRTSIESHRSIESAITQTIEAGTHRDLAEKESRALTRRELSRNRVASLGVRLGGPPGPRGEPTTDGLPDDHPYFLRRKGGGKPECLST